MPVPEASREPPFEGLCYIRVSGITGNTRGALHARTDGTQTDRSARSILQTAERLNIVNGAISALAIAPGDRGSLTLFGRPTDHEPFARHIAESEQWVDVQALGRTVRRTVRERSLRPARPDEHGLDCLVGCAVAASLVGIRVSGQGARFLKQRRRYTQQDLRRL